jgi:hypothetical protein
VAPARITLFYALLGVAVLLSARLWAGLLERARGAARWLLNALLGLAALLPALTGWWPALLLSGLMFGGVFLSVVASTTALVRHNLPAQLGGRHQRLHHRLRGRADRRPTVVGWIADGPGGLVRGLVFSALALGGRAAGLAPAAAGGTGRRRLGTGLIARAPGPL